MENVFAKNFSPGLFTIDTYGDNMVHASRTCRKFVYCSWRSDHATDHFCHVAILNAFQESYLFWRGSNLLIFERAETNYDKVARSNEASMAATALES